MQIVTLALVQHVRPVAGDDLAKLWYVIPVCLVAAVLGLRVFNALSNAQFKNVVLVVLSVSGVLLLTRSW